MPRYLLAAGLAAVALVFIGGTTLAVTPPAPEPATAPGTSPDFELPPEADAPVAEQWPMPVEDFLAGRISSIHVVYMRFYSTGRQRPEVVQLLPLVPDRPGAESSAPVSSVAYEFRPDPATLLSELLPASFRIRLFQAFLDAAVSEHVARMTAMKAATDASESMIKTLTRQYNRARQTHITMELLDIVGGANALA